MMKALVQPRYVWVALAVALLLACFPTSAEAKMVGSLASRSQQLTPRQAREAEVARLLSEKKVAEALASAGLTPAQVRSRLDRLDDQQLEELARNLESVKAGKGGAYFLIGIAVVLLAVLIYMTVEAA